MAIEGSTLAAIDYVVKSRYSKEKMWNLAAREHILMNMLRKSGKFTGKDLLHPVQYGNAQGISNTFTDAQAGGSSHKGIRWTLTRAKKYGYHEFDAETIAATEDDEGSFVREIRHGVNSLLTSWGDDASLELYRDGANDIGKISSIASLVLTLTVAADAQNFEIDMRLEGNTARTGAGTAHGITTSPKVTAVDEDAGTVTVDSLGSAAIAVNDFLYRKGNRDNGIKGLPAWLPSVAPTTGDSHFGVDRSAHPTRLAGHRVAAAATTDLDEALLDAAEKVHRKKGRIKWIFVNATNFTTLVHKLGAKIERTEGGGATFGFEFIRMATAAGIAKVIPDPDCPSTDAYLIDPRSWVIKHLKALPHTVKDDGQTFMRLTADDGVEMRARGWWQLVCGAPGHNARVTGL